MNDRPIPWTSTHHREIVQDTLTRRKTAECLGIPGRDRPREAREREARRVALLQAIEQAD